MYPFLDLATVNRPFMPQIEEAMARVCRSGRYVGGEEVERLEDNLIQLTGASHAVGVSNGLDALRLILRAWVIEGKLRQGDEVIVPANTYVASVLAIVDAGLTPVMAEPSLRTLNLDTSRLDSYLTPLTRAIMPVHLYGRPCFDEELMGFAEGNGLLVVEDNAQAIGAVATVAGFSSASRITGSLGHAAAFSFYPTKNLGALGDAGAVTTSDPSLAATVRALANYGSDRRYHNIHAGFNCRLDPLQAAVLNVKFPTLRDESLRRAEIAAIYDRLITNPLVVKPSSDSYPLSHVWHQYVVMTPSRDLFRKYLADNGVMTDIHYATPPHRQPCFKATLGELHLPLTQQIADAAVSLPISACTSPSDAAEISGIINSFDPNNLT